MDSIKTIGEYIILSKLGSGSYGVVYKVEKMSDHNIYVIKQIPLDNLTSKQIYEVKQEAKILASINSIYVVRYYDSFEENNSLNIVMEYCDGGDLSKFLDENKKTKILLKENLVWNIFLKITIGLASIHNLKILHRDLKALNIFLTKDLDVKIGDLGVAKMLTHTKFAKTFIGTPYYLSPELCQDIPYNDKSDVWALGCILYELCTYKHPFTAKNQGALIIKILKDTPSPIHNYYSNELQELIYSLLEKDEQIRPSCYDILVTPYILDKAKQLGLYDHIVNLYPHIINNNVNYDYYNNSNEQYIYENENDINYNNNMYEDYSDGFINHSMFESNINNFNDFNYKYYYSALQDNKSGNYYMNNYEQNNMYPEYNNNHSNIYVNENNHKKRMISSNSEGYLKNVIYIKNKNPNNNSNIKNKKICSFYNKNNVIYNGKKIHINPMLRKHRSDLNDNFENKKNIKNEKNNKIIYFDYKNGKKYIKKPIKNNGIEELFRNKSNEDIKKQNINVEFNNRKKSSPKNEIQEINKDEKNKGKKNLDIITEFANNLNNYVEQHNIQNQCTIFQNRANDPEPNSEESPKDNLRKKNKMNNNLNGNDDFKIINNNEENTKNEKESTNNIKSISSLTSNDYEYSLTTSNNITKIDSTKINSILQNHKNLKILKNLEKNDKNEENLNINSDNKDKDKEFEENLYSSEEEKDGNIYDSEEESDDGQSEKVKEIVEKKGRDSSMTKSMMFLTNEEIKNKLKNERNDLKEKVEKYKSEILKLIGEEDYNYIINIYSKVDNDLERVNDIYQKFEEYIKDKYEEDKKENLKNLYSSFICYDCQLSKKEQHLKKYL